MAPILKVPLLLLPLLALAQAGVFDSIAITINTINCLPQYERQIETCSRILTPFYTVQSTLARNPKRKDCCALAASQTCTRTLSSYFCGAESLGPVDASLFFRQTSMGCDSVNAFSDCMSPWVLLILPILEIWAIISCIRCCCCRKAKKVVIVTSINQDVDPLLKQEEV